MRLRPNSGSRSDAFAPHGPDARVCGLPGPELEVKRETGCFLAVRAEGRDLDLVDRDPFLNRIEPTLDEVEEVIDQSGITDVHAQGRTHSLGGQPRSQLPK
jgi:hypothetical protein